MNMRRLGNSDIMVTPVCLGSMTWGIQNSESEGHAQIDMAIDAGVNFIDTAEMYPVPRNPDLYGRTEEIIGSWLKKRGGRDRIVLASKVSGPRMVPDIRDMNVRLDRPNIEKAIDDSLKRLNTDYLDLYQLHWPDRRSNFFGELGYRTPEGDETSVPLEETLGVLKDLVAAGKVRTIGLSNETPWGVMKCLELARRHGLPAVQSVQNPYNLLNRTFEIGLAEIAHREGPGLLAYSPLAMGVLSGKYLNDAKPENARLTLYPAFQRYSSPEAKEATRRYVTLAQSFGLDPSQMAISYIIQQKFVTSAIIGATTEQQLKTNLHSVDIVLEEELLREIEKIHRSYPNPSP